MRNTRRLAALGATLIVTASLFAGPASAQTEADLKSAKAFEGSAMADALTLTLFGQSITSSAVTAAVSPAVAKATMTETLLGPLNEAVVFTAEQPGGEASVKPDACVGSDLTAIPAINRFDVTCGEATARSGENDGAARAIGAELVVQPSVSGVLETLTIQEPAQEATDELFTQIDENLVQPITGNPLGDLADDAVQTVQDVVGDVLGLQSTARIVVAPALAQVDATECGVTSMAQAQGVRVELLPVDEVGATNGLLPEDLAAGEPLVTITLGNAKDTLTVPRACAANNNTPGDPVREQTAAIACIELGTTALSDTLGLPAGPQCLEGGQTVCLLEDTPLESCVTLAAANADGGTDAGSIQLFKGVNGGADLAIGRANAAGTAAPPLLPAAAPAGELPRTGGPAVFPLIGGGLLAAAAIARRFARKA